MNQARQVVLLDRVTEDYLSGLVGLGPFIGKVEALLAVIDDKEFGDTIFEDLLALEEVHAVSRTNDGFDFEGLGKPIVERAARSILDKTRVHLVKVRLAHCPDGDV